MHRKDKVIECMRDHCKVSFSSPFVESQMHLIGVYIVDFRYCVLVDLLCSHLR